MNTNSKPGVPAEHAEGRGAGIAWAGFWAGFTDACIFTAIVLMGVLAVLLMVALVVFILCLPVAVVWAIGEFIVQPIVNAF